MTIGGRENSKWDGMATNRPCGTCWLQAPSGLSCRGPPWRRVIKIVIDSHPTTTLLGAYCTRTRNEGALGNGPRFHTTQDRKNYAPKACELTVKGPIETVS